MDNNDRNRFFGLGFCTLKEREREEKRKKAKQK